MAVLGFAGKQSAEGWIADVEQLNADTEIVLKNVSMCLEDIGQDGKGDALDQLVSVGTEMVNSTSLLVSSFKNMVDVVTNIVGNILQAIAGNDELISGVANAIGRFGN